MVKTLPNLYLISDRNQVHENWTFIEVIEVLLRAGVKMVQLREKDLTAAELFPLAQKMRALTTRYNSLLIINDRIDIAQAVNADGVHLGHHSLSVETTRKILGKKYLIGASTHSKEEIAIAQQQGADFATYGPIYSTPSKAGMGEPVGLGSLQAICQNYRLPIYALGGIKSENCRQTMATGAFGVALISALIKAEDPAAMYHDLFRQLA